MDIVVLTQISRLRSQYGVAFPYNIFTFTSIHCITWMKYASHFLSPTGEGFGRDDGILHPELLRNLECSL